MEPYYTFIHEEPNSREFFDFGIEIKGFVPQRVVNLTQTRWKSVCELALHCIAPKKGGALIAVGRCDEVTVTALAVLELRARNLSFDRYLVYGIGKAFRCPDEFIRKNYKLITAIRQKCRIPRISLDERVEFVYRCLLDNFTWFEIHELVGEYEKQN